MTAPLKTHTPRGLCLTTAPTTFMNLFPASLGTQAVGMTDEMYRQTLNYKMLHPERYRIIVQEIDADTPLACRPEDV
jgi:hypothetical protein